MARKIFFFLTFFLLLSPVVHGQQQSVLKEFAALLPGVYSTEAMHKKDTTLFHVELHIVQIWKTDADGFWFYLEQAEVKNLEKPYRQTILHVTLSNDQVVSSNLPLKDRLRFAGAWKDPNLLSQISKSDLETGNACDIIFTRVSPNVFTGSTGKGGCANQYKGATYFTNESELSQHGLKSWDRGWTAAGKLAWGPASQGYTFDRITN